MATSRTLGRLRRRRPALARRLNTSFIERYHRTDRGLVAYKQRLTSHLSQKPWNYDNASWLAITYYNFCRAHRSLEGRTPAQEAGITSCRWSLLEVLSTPVSRRQILLARNCRRGSRAPRS